MSRECAYWGCGNEIDEGEEYYREGSEAPYCSYSCMVIDTDDAEGKYTLAWFAGDVEDANDWNDWDDDGISG